MGGWRWHRWALGSWGAEGPAVSPGGAVDGSTRGERPGSPGPGLASHRGGHPCSACPARCRGPARLDIAAHDSALRRLSPPFLRAEAAARDVEPPARLGRKWQSCREASARAAAGPSWAALPELGPFSGDEKGRGHPCAGVGLQLLPVRKRGTRTQCRPEEGPRGPGRQRLRPRLGGGQSGQHLRPEMHPQLPAAGWGAGRSSRRGGHGPRSHRQ